LVKSLSEIASAKSEIFNHLAKDKGIAILNSSMNMLDQCLVHAKNLGVSDICLYGSSEQDKVYLSNVERLENGSLRLKYVISESDYEVVTKMIPPYFAENFAAGLAVLNSLSLDPELGLKAIANFEPDLGRGKIAEATDGDRKYDIICDYYNSNPKALECSLSYLAELNNPNKVAVLGSMGELGEFESELHGQMIEAINNSGVKKLFLVGPPMQDIADQFGDGIQVFDFKDSDQLAGSIKSSLNGGELILIKGSRFHNFEKIAKMLGVKNAL